MFFRLAQHCQHTLLAGLGFVGEVTNKSTTEYFSLYFHEGFVPVGAPCTQDG